MKHTEREHRGDFTIQFTDKTGDVRSREEMEAFVDELRVVAQHHGFDRWTWGPAGVMAKSSFESIAKRLLEDTLGRI